MIVTIYVDASLCQSTGCGGWSCWIKSDRYSIQKAGAFKNKSKSSSDAETAAACNALKVAIEAHKHIKDIHYLIVSDCMHVVRLVRGTAKTDIEITFKKLCLSVESISSKHGKGHTSGKDSRSFINRKVDVSARKWRRDKRS